MIKLELPLTRAAKVVLAILAVNCLISCKDHNANGDPRLYYATDEDFKDTANVSVQLREGFKLDLWAPGPLLANAVAISFDDNGTAYVTETQRRKSSDLDIREHRDWMTDDLALQSLDDTRKLLLTKLAADKSQENEWLTDFNEDGVHDWQDLEVQNEYVRKIWDSDGDGRADVASVFADGFNDMIGGVAAGILYHDNAVFLTAAPNVYRLTDMDADGDADHKEIISTGFGIHIAYAGHDMSGLTMGPDGRIYWSIGDIGVNAVNQQGQKFEYPNQGAVMRANPDGSDFEVYAHGLRNPQELAFDAHGNLISVDNDGDHPGEHERFVHILEGSDSGWRINWQFGKYNLQHEDYKVWIDEELHKPHFYGQAAYIIPPLALAPDGPAGLVYQPGTALNSQWENTFFGSYFKGSSAHSMIQAFRLEPKGASFELKETVDILSGIVSTGLAFGSDGALYINDWLEGYEKKPAGRIWKLDVIQRDSSLRADTRSVLQQGARKLSNEQLEWHLASDDMRIRMNAQFELVRRDKRVILLSVLQKPVKNLAKIHAIWGLGQIARADQSFGHEIIPLLKSEIPEIRAQAAKVLGDARLLEAADALVELLEDPSARVVYFAAEALGKMAVKQAFEPLVELLAQVEDSDPHLRHGLIYALHRLGMESELAKLSVHQSLHVRLGAVVALRNMGSHLLIDFLQDPDTLVLIETARAIHDDQSVHEALPALAECLMTTKISNEAFLRRAINANLRIGDVSCASRLSKYALLTSAPLEMKYDALWALGYWQNPPELDRVEGRYRKLPSRNLLDAQDAFANFAAPLLKDSDTMLVLAAVKAVGRLKVQDSETELIQFALDRNENREIRRAALHSLNNLKSPSLVEVIGTCLEAEDEQLRSDALALLAEASFPVETVVDLLGEVLNKGTQSEKQQALQSLSKIDANQASLLLDQWLQKLLDNKLEPALQLDLINAVESSSFSELRKKLEVFETIRTEKSPLIRFEETLYGGDAVNGRTIFFNNNSAQCIRCHKVGDYGGEVGPVLTNIASGLNRESILEAMIDPSVRLAPGYGSLTIELANGEKATGILEEETSETIRLKTSSGTKTFAIETIETKTYLPSSMPSMIGVLSKEEIRDLMSYLMKLN